MTFILKIIHLLLIKILENKDIAYIRVIANYVGNIVYLLNFDFVKKLKTNEKDFKNYNAKKVLINFFQFYFETLFMYNNAEKLIDKVNFNEFEKINKLLKKYNGMIFIGGHYCNWELCGIFFSRFYDFYVILRKHKNSFINNLLKELRKRNKFNMIFLDENNALSLKDIKTIRKKENFILSLLIDEYNNEGKYINFLGNDMKLNHKFIKFLKLVKKPVAIGGIRRVNNGFEINSTDYILPEEVGNENIVERIFKGVENFIKQDINQWILLEEK